MPAFVADRQSRPLFLKVVYHGPAAMEQLAGWDSNLVVGILGGSSGTTFDAFHQLWEAKKYGARVALYGRMINNSEHQPTFIRHLRALADGVIEPREAIRSYHAELAKLNVAPYRSLDDDLQATQRAGAYRGSGQPVAAAGTTPSTTADEPDFSKMTLQEKIAWNRERWKRILG